MDTEMNTHLVHTASCPACGYVVDRASNNPQKSESRNPVPGDISVCWRCGAINQFTPGLQLIPQPLHELSADQRDEAMRLSESIRRYHREMMNSQ